MWGWLQDGQNRCGGQLIVSIKEFEYNPPIQADIPELRINLTSTFHVRGERTDPDYNNGKTISGQPRWLGQLIWQVLKPSPVVNSAEERLSPATKTGDCK